jgi:hypothetical protein
MKGKSVTRGKHARLRVLGGTARRRPKAFAALAVGTVAGMVLGANFVISAQGAGASSVPRTVRAHATPRAQAHPAAALAPAAGLTVTDLATGATAAGLASSLTGSGVTVSNVTYTGSPRAGGSFTSGDDSIVGFGSGIVFSTGKVETYPGEAGTCSKGVEGPNVCYDTVGSDNSTAFGLPGDTDLDALASPYATYDAAVLEFDFVPTYSTVQFKYVFGSDEYSDYANSSFDDVFGFYVNGTNCALVPGTSEPVSVNTINNGNPNGDTTPHNAQYFRDNVYPNGPTINTELDGLTTVLTCNATVNPGVTNHMKLAIADASDDQLDSAVFIAGGSLISGTQVTTSLSGGDSSGATISVGSGTPVTDQATLSGANAGQATGTVSYKVYTDANCTTLADDLGSVDVTGGVVPASAAFTASVAGSYYWQASYSGDALNNASTSACGAEVETVEGAATTLATSLSGGDHSGTAITVPAGTAVTDSATLSGTAESGATGTVTYSVYSDSACTNLVSSGPAEQIPAGSATLPDSAPVTLTTPGTYYWTAFYSGDANNQASASPCGSETETVSAVALPTSLTTTLSGGGKTGTAISVTAGTAVTDSATLSGTNAATATGTVTYNVYSDSACSQLVQGGPAQQVTAGKVPGSAAVTLTAAGPYYWQVAYSGDQANQASVSTCGSEGGETETVTAPPTTLTTSLTGGGKTGTAITIEAGTAVTDTATLSGAAASGATGTVTFNVYSDSACTKLAASGGKEAVSGGKVPASPAVTLKTAGKYYWTASYSGDASNLASASTCGSETLTVTPAPSVDTQTTAFSASSATAKVTTTVAGDTLVALVGARGPAAGGQTVTVSGGGLTWHLAGRENSGRGDAEIWTAKASGTLKAVSVKATARTAGFMVTMTIAAIKNATGTGALAKSTAKSVGPKVTIKTTHALAFVISMGDDWTHSVTPKPVAGQYLVSRVVDSTDTFWAQATSPLIAQAGTSVGMADTSPTTDPFDLIALEVF